MRGDSPGAWYRLWWKNIWARQLFDCYVQKNAIRVSNSCSSVPRPSLASIYCLLGMYCLYRSLIVNPILLDSGGVMAGCAREDVDGLEGLTGFVSGSTIMCFDSLSSLSWLMDIVVFGFVGWYLHVVIEIHKKGFQLSKGRLFEKTKKARIFCQGHGIWTMASASHDMMDTHCREHWYHSWTTVQSQWSSMIRSDAPHCDWIFWNDTSVGTAQKVNAYVWVHLGWIYDWITDPSLVCDSKVKHLDYGISYTEILETSIETWISTLRWGEWVGFHVCRPSLLTILMRPYSLPKISPNRNPYTDTRDAELDPEQYLMQVGMRYRVWDTVLMKLLADTSMLGNECISTRISMIHNAISLEEFNITLWRSPERFVYKLSPHSIYEARPSMTQLLDSPCEKMSISAHIKPNFAKTHILESKDAAGGLKMFDKPIEWEFGKFYLSTASSHEQVQHTESIEGVSKPARVILSMKRTMSINKAYKNRTEYDNQVPISGSELVDRHI